MPDYDFPGGANPRDTGSFLTGDFQVQTNYFNMPKGPLFFDGYRGGLISHVRGWFSPYSGTHGVRIGLGGSYTAYASRPAEGVADTRWLPLDAIKPPGPLQIRFDVENAGIVFGRGDGEGTTTGVGYNYTWPGALAGQARVIWSAGAPTDLKCSVDDQGRVKLVWKAPIDNGGSPITRYWIHYSDKPNFATYTTVTTNGERTATLSGLTAGKSWYFRVLAGNRFNVLRGYGSLASLTVIAFVPIVSVPDSGYLEDLETGEAIPKTKRPVPNSVGQFTVKGEFFSILANSPASSNHAPELLPIVGRVVFVPDVRSPLTVYPEDLTFVPTEIHAWIRSDGSLVAPGDGFLEEPLSPEFFETQVNLIAPSQLSLSIRNWSWTVHVVPTPGEEWGAFSIRIPGDTKPGDTIYLTEEYINTHTIDLTRRRDPGVRSSRLYEVDFTSAPYPFGFDENLDFIVLKKDLSMWKVYN